jgi:nucleotidyltransferase substrate binding protein (TIGR01987 family)
MTKKTLTQETGDEKLNQSLEALRHALEFVDKAKKDDFYYAGICKTFETCLEYAWKTLKRRATEEGLEVFSPKEAIKIGGRMGFIDDVDVWLDFLKDRNLAVHDYLGISNEEYLETIQKFFAEAQRLLKKIS